VALRTKGITTIRTTMMMMMRVTGGLVEAWSLFYVLPSHIKLNVHSSGFLNVVHSSWFQSTGNPNFLPSKTGLSPGHFPGFNPSGKHSFDRLSAPR